MGIINGNGSAPYYIGGKNNISFPIMWAGIATTIRGIATFIPTLDGTINTASFFTNITGYFATANLNVSSAVSVPMCGIKSISADKRTITVNVINGRTLVALGATTQFVPDGTEVSLILYGN